jgi:hypothetical protein
VAALPLVVTGVVELPLAFALAVIAAVVRAVRAHRRAATA